MKHKTYKNRGYKEMNSTETPYLNIFTGQRIFIDPEVVPPKGLHYVEDLNPYQRNISVVMDTHQKRLIRNERENCAGNIYSLINMCLEQENSQQDYLSAGYEYPVWFDEFMDIVYFGVYPQSA